MNKNLNLLANLVSPSLVRSLNPETYTLYCVYSEEEVNNQDYGLLEDYVHRIKHIKVCENYSSCQYYKRLVSLFYQEANNAQVGGPAVIAATAFGGLFVTGGLSLIALGVFSFGSLIAGALLSEKNITKTIQEIEDELKLKQEKE